MTIGIIGSGNVGGTLGTRWAQAGHTVIFGSRNPQAADIQGLLAKAGANARAASQKEAAQAAEIVLIATPWPATRSAIEGLGDLAGKVIMDATNPLRPDLSALELGTTTSAAEQVASWARGAKVVKAFNTVGFNIMANPKFGAGRPVLFYCGDDAAAKQMVRPLIEPLGFEAVDAGPLRQARLLEPFALLWISLALEYGQGREIAFQLLRR
jgi:8-hydroxy-5-deazaflavin:NADPH oxidoreductase